MEKNNIVERNYKLVSFTKWGYKCSHGTYPNKTQAINYGRFLKHNEYAFSYIVYGYAIKDESGKVKRQIVHKG